MAEPEGTFARCINQTRKDCEREIQWIPRPILGDGEVLHNRCHFCRQKDRLIPVDSETVRVIREARARFKEAKEEEKRKRREL
jgi:hypothetical protein